MLLAEVILVMHQHDCKNICYFKTAGGLNVKRGSKMWTKEIRNIIKVQTNG